MIEVKPSDIHGLGLFARQFIPAGTTIGHIEGESTTEDGDHVLWIDDIKGVHVTNDMRYINHSSQPNAAYYDDLTVVALRDILPGDEITHNYDGDPIELDLIEIGEHQADPSQV